MADEDRRLAELHAYEILDTPPDPTLDRIVDLAARIFDVPVACISLADARRLFLKAAHGMDATELGVEPGLCVTTVETNESRQIRDLLLDDVGSRHPLVAAAPHLRFYAGSPLRSRDGHVLGTVCVLDERPRELDTDEMACLDLLAEVVMDRLESLRREAERNATARAVDDRAAWGGVAEAGGSATLGARALEAQRLESLGAVAGGIAHDFNNMLAAIRGFSSLAARALPDDPDRAAGYLERVDVATTHGRDLCNQLLTYAGSERYMVSSIDLSTLIDEMRDLLGLSVSAKASLELRLAEGLPRVHGDATQIRQVILNVVTNASEALPNGMGSIAVETASTTPSDAVLVERVYGAPLEAGQYATLTVRDDGTGMDPATVPRIFDPQYTTKLSGHGLGMAAVGGIMRSHRGAVDIETAPGRGTTVTLFFPVATGSTTAGR